MSIPGGRFGYLLEHELIFITYFKLSTTFIFAEKGIKPSFDNKRIQNAHSLWKNKARRWLSDLEPRKNASGEFSQPKELSDLKLAGSLIWALNKTQPISNIQELSSTDCSALQKRGVNAIQGIDNSRLFQSFYNEAPVFLFVYYLFCELEACRGEEKRIDFKNPPLTQHFFRNFCILMREKSPDPFELYMIFKAFDLYGIKHPGN